MTAKPPPPSVAAPTPAEIAYGYFLRANEYHRPHSEPLVLLEKARELDPEYAPTHALLARIHAWIYFNGYSPGEAQKARERIGEAKRLSPDLPVVKLAEAYVENLLTNDPHEVLALLEQIPSPPGLELAEPLMIAAAARLRAGSLDRSMGLLEQLEQKLTGRTSSLGREHRRVHNCREILLMQADIHRARREFGLADAVLGEITNIVPYDTEVVDRRALNMLEWKADSGSGLPSSEARALLADRETQLSYPIRILFDLFDAEEAGDDAQGIYWQIVDCAEANPDRPGGPRDGSFYFWHEAFAFEKAKGRDAACEMVDLCRRDLERLNVFMGQSLGEEHRLTNCNVRARLAIAYAYLGDHDKARSVIEQVVEDTQAEPFYGPSTREHRARVLILLGESDAALRELESLSELDYRYAIHRNQLRYEPIWRPLRSDDRFLRLAS